MKKNKYLLITGGLGYIGSNTIIELKKSSYKIIILDNLINSSLKQLTKIRKLFKKKIIFIRDDIRNKSINKIFHKYNINAVIHFAGLKSVKESEFKKKMYFDNNINGTLNLLESMKKNKCYNIIFSSSACVYDSSAKPPYNEKSKLNPKSFYGYTKLKNEKILQNFSYKNPRFNCIILRYFNPIGTDKSGLLNDDPKKPENIIPKIMNVIKGKNKIFDIYGQDYPTKDGTCLRDYIHISDLAKSHVKSLKLLKNNIFQIINIGTGVPYSVKDVLDVFNKYLTTKIKYRYKSKRVGDVPICFSNVKKQKKILNFKPKFNLNNMIKNIVEIQK
jgi:UDP-glucose 4-epimerase